jgi:predicted ribosome quality control (RQC) complex YloA/Tae2 family protein
VASKGKGWREVEVDGFEVLVGKGARANDELTFRIARPRDLWLHASGFAGSHVVVRRPESGGEVPRHVVERAAELAAFHSKAREARGKVVVHVCLAGDVRKPRGAPPGQVELKRFDTLRVYARDAAAPPDGADTTDTTDRSP